MEKNKGPVSFVWNNASFFSYTFLAHFCLLSDIAGNIPGGQFYPPA
jgi:hypothetical protein